MIFALRKGNQILLFNILEVLFMCCHNHQSNSKDQKGKKRLWDHKISIFWLVLMGMIMFIFAEVVSAPGMSVKLKAILPSLSFLICPLMMLWMMRGHGHRSQSGQDQNENKSCH
jgi:hypothetical protein